MRMLVEYEEYDWLIDWLIDWHTYVSFEYNYFGIAVWHEIFVGSDFANFSSIWEN